MIPRAVLAIGAVVLAVGAGLAWSAVRADREFRRLLAEGDRAVAAGQTLDAIEAFSGALALQPDSMVAHLKRGDSYRRRGDLEPALRDLRVASTLDPAAPQPVELLADVNASMERHERAVELYRRFLALDERSPRVLYKLGTTLYRLNRLDDAVDALRRALALDDSLAEAHYLLGVCLREQRRPQDALRALRRAVALDASLVAPREALADLYRSLGRYREHLEQLEAVAALEPERPARLVRVAVAYAEAGRPSAALATLDRLSDPLPADERLQTEIARGWLQAARLRNDRTAMARARAILTPLAAKAEASGATLALLGEAQLLSGDHATAERTLQRAGARLPVPPTAFLNLARAAERLGHVAIARSALIDFATLSDDDAAVHDAVIRIAALSLQLKEPDAAAEWATRALAENNPPALAFETLARAEILRGRPGAASATLARGLTEYPRHPALTRLTRQFGR